MNWILLMLGLSLVACGNEDTSTDTSEAIVQNGLSSDNPTLSLAIKEEDLHDCNDLVLNQLVYLIDKMEFVTCTESGWERIQLAPNSLIKTEEIIAGENNLFCKAGGMEVKSGLDKNYNGKLDDAEIDDTKRVCNGTSGSDGQSCSVSSNANGATLECGEEQASIENGTDGLDGDDMAVVSEWWYSTDSLDLSNTNIAGEAASYLAYITNIRVTKFTSGLLLSVGGSKFDYDDNNEMFSAEFSHTKFVRGEEIEDGVVYEIFKMDVYTDMELWIGLIIDDTSITAEATLDLDANIMDNEGLWINYPLLRVDE